MECFPLESIKEDFNKLIYNRTYLKAMEYRFIVGDNFGLAGSMGTGKTSILNYLEEKIRAKNMGVCIRINSSLCNEDIFFRLLLFELLKNNIVKKIFNKDIKEYKKYIYSTQSLEDFLRSLIYFEPRKELDHARVITLYKEYLKEQFSSNADVDFIFNTYTLKNIIVEMLRKSPRRIFILVDDYDKFMVDPMSREGGENRLGLFLSSIKEFTEFSKTTWVFALPRSYYEKFKIGMPFSNQLNFLGMFSEVYITLPFNFTELRKYITQRIEKLDLYQPNFIDETALKLLYVMTKGNPKMINYVIKSGLYNCKIRNGKNLTIDDMVSVLLVNGKYDKRDGEIIKYISQNKQTFSNDKLLLEILGVDNIALMMRLNRLLKKELISFKFFEGIKYFQLNYEEE